MGVVTCIRRSDLESEHYADATVIGDCSERDDSVHVERYAGKVLGTYERNGYHDSDFFAVVWTGEKVATVEYASTRGWTYHNGATADATDDVKDAAASYLAKVTIGHVREDDLLAAADVDKGKRVKVVRGRKVPIGTTGTVGWIGPDKFSHSYSTGTYTKRRIGLDTDEGERVWLAAGNVEVLDAGHYLTSEAELTKRQLALKEQILRDGSFVGVSRSWERQAAWFADSPNLSAEQVAELEAERAAEARLVGQEA